MIKHEMEWGDDEYSSDDPICTRCEKPYSRHAERIGITHEDEAFEADDSWKDSYRSIANTW